MPTKAKHVLLPGRARAATGARLALANGRRHLACADQLAATDQFGSACAHLVIALEEVQKAHILSLVHAGLPAGDLGLSKVLTHHVTRHQLAFWDTLLLTQVGILLKHDDSMRAATAGPTEDAVREGRAAVMASILADIRLIAEARPEAHPVAATFEWLSTAQDRKNHGFYVDFRDGEWRDPASLSPDVFARGRQVTARFIDGKAEHIAWALASNPEEQATLLANHRAAIDSLARAADAPSASKPSSTPGKSR